jgi:hypothetical protein
LPGLIEKIPETEIKEHWDRSYHITRLAHGDNQWVVVMSQDPGYADTQVYFIRPYLPEAEIKQFWNEGYHITRACLQSSSDAAFRKSRIEEWRGSMVSLQTRPSLAYGDNQWVVIISQGAGYADTRPYVWRNYFPEAELQEYWTTGHHITSLAYGDPQWAVVMLQKQRG